MKARQKLLAAAAVIAAAAVAAILVTGPWKEDGGSAATTSSSRAIPQPPLDKLNRRTRRRLAPDAKRVDLIVPSFSKPAEITNPLFPVNKLHSVILLGRLDGKPWRAETTLLPGTRTVDWNGRQIEAIRSQFVASEPFSTWRT